MGPRAGLGGCGKSRLHRDSIPTSLSEPLGQILSILWNPKVHYRIHKRPSPVCTLSYINTVQVTKYSLKPDTLSDILKHADCGKEFLASCPSPQAGGPHPVGCPLQHI